MGLDLFHATGKGVYLVRVKSGAGTTFRSVLITRE